MRERELKPGYGAEGASSHLSLPMRERELKLLRMLQEAQEVTSLPMRERELKPANPIFQTRKC